MEKNMKSKRLHLVVGIVMAALVLNACPNSTNGNGGGPEAFPGNPSGTETGNAFGQGGQVYVTITMVDGWITDVQVTTEHETVDIGTLAIDRLPLKIKQQNEYVPLAFLPHLGFN
ncbi:MAG: hypothetical protein LBP93_07365 [Treponema sp.]|jgi:hypothetical protein|nr:hypothetical protein [Treponema sp.]